MEDKIKQPWMREAISLLGTKEIPGSKSNRSIVEWATEVSSDVADIYTTDSIPWCGLFVAYCINESGIEPISQPLWALSWKKFGTELSEGAFGAILVFKRDGGGHVGFYVSEDEDYYHVLGGNQSDMVCVSKVSKDNCVGIRWPEEAIDLFEKGVIIAELDSKIISSEQMA